MGRQRKTKEVRELGVKWRKELREIVVQVEKYFPYIKNLIHVGNQLSININRWMYDPSVLNDENGTLLDMVAALPEDQKMTFLQKYLNVSLSLREYQERVLIEYTKVSNIINIIKSSHNKLKTEEELSDLIVNYTENVIMPIQDVADNLAEVVVYLKPIITECEEGVVRSLGKVFFNSINDLIISSEKVSDDLVKDQINTIKDLNLTEVFEDGSTIDNNDQVEVMDDVTEEEPMVEETIKES